MLEPGSNGEFVSKVTLTLKADGDGWAVDKAEGELIDCAEVTPDPEFLAEFKDLHEKSLELASREVGAVGKTFIDPLEFLPGIPSAVLEDDAVTDLVNKVQMERAGADVSLAALFDATSNLQAGPFLHRDSVKIYKYDNTLYGVKVTGATVHYASEVVDGGQIIAQKAVDVLPGDTPEILQRRVMEQAEWVLLPQAAELVSAQIVHEKESNI